MKAAAPDVLEPIKSSDRSPRKKLFSILLALLALIAVLYVPYFIHQPPSASASWLFSYNNRAGAFLIIFFVTVGTFLTQGMHLEIPSYRPSRSLPKSVGYCSLLLVLVASLIAIRFAGQLSPMNEWDYPLRRIWLLANHRTPYVDFEYSYGAASLYVPIFLHRFLHAGLIQSYEIFWIASVLLGTLLLFKIISNGNAPAQSKLSIFLLLFLFGLLSLPVIGIGYTYLRFLSPIYFILIVQNSILRSRTGNLAFSSFLAVPFAIALLLISPETAICFAFASVALVALSTERWDARRVGSATLFVISLLLCFLIAFQLRVLDTLIADSGGADSFPVILAPHIVLYMWALFLCACYLFRQVVMKQLDDPNISIILGSLPMVPAAMGRCDPGHVYWNGFGIFMVSMFYLSRSSVAWKRFRAAFLFFLIVIPSLTSIPLGRAHTPSLPAGTPTHAPLETLYPTWKRRFIAPFGYRQYSVEPFLSPRIELGRYDARVNRNTESAIGEAISEMARNPDYALILPERFESNCETNPEGMRVAISLLFGFPYFGSPRVHAESVRKPICNYILANYEMEEPPNDRNFGYGLWIRKGPEGTSQKPTLASGKLAK
jgi:hypothetical protein